MNKSFYHNTIADNKLVTPDSRRHPLTLLSIQGVINDRSVLQLSLPCVAICEGQGVLPPVLLHRDGGLALQWLRVIQFIHTVFEIFPGMSSPALLPGLGPLDDLVAVDHAVLQLQSLHQITVPDHPLVRNLEVSHVFPEGIHLLDTFPHNISCAEDSSVCLHGLLHL